MLDADSIIEPGFLDACQAALSSGAPAVQARSEGSIGPRLTSQLSLVAFSLQGITLPRGRDRLGLSVRLRGTGMAIRRDVALRHRFVAPASEDLYFTLDLLLDGMRCRHVDTARLRSDAAGSWNAFGGQKVRYEAGRMAAAREYVPRLLRRAMRQRDAACLEAAWFLLTPPFALGAVSLVAAAGSPPLRRPGRQWPLPAPRCSSSLSSSSPGSSRRARARAPGSPCSWRRGISPGRRWCSCGRSRPSCAARPTTRRRAYPTRLVEEEAAPRARPVKVHPIERPRPSGWRSFFTSIRTRASRETLGARDRSELVAGKPKRHPCSSRTTLWWACTSRSTPSGTSTGSPSACAVGAGACRPSTGSMPSGRRGAARRRGIQLHGPVAERPRCPAERPTGLDFRDRPPGWR